ncbi:hypothetical protein CSOJ01_08440 [Colletotrichum sojae]|uniref:MYND-type domain-containing protein n=1 Tax=Colletotrichum sojae TaxID=2175907 RepID=A0A8H6MS15_9PEZI|nr:hypothetical protein CSOJ01_08440 [Colletotrichum sojae]
MEDLVRSFNLLRRPETSPSGLPNHYVFGVRQIPLDQPSNMVLAVNPQSRFLFTDGPDKILSLPSVSARVEVVIRLLLEMFINGIDPENSLVTKEEPNELCRVGTCSAEESQILDESHTVLLEKFSEALGLNLAPLPQDVAPGDPSRCHGCRRMGENFSAPLWKCSACQQAWYHSQDCQRNQWKEHKPTCLANRAAPAPNQKASGPSMSSSNSKSIASAYYNKVAHLTAEGQALIRSLSLKYPPTRTAPEGLRKPLRRLVLAGKDTPENLKLLFGPNWSSQAKEYEDARMEVPIDPPRGSPSYAMNAYHDNGAPPSTPRPASDAEREKVAQIRGLQAKIRERVGAGKAPSWDDREAILLSFGPNWPEHLQTYMLATNTMDQGVQPR